MGHPRSYRDWRFRFPMSQHQGHGAPGVWPALGAKEKAAFWAAFFCFYSLFLEYQVWAGLLPGWVAGKSSGMWGNAGVTVRKGLDEISSEGRDYGIRVQVTGCRLRVSGCRCGGKASVPGGLKVPRCQSSGTVNVFLKGQGLQPCRNGVPADSDLQPLRDVVAIPDCQSYKSTIATSPDRN